MPDDVQQEGNPSSLQDQFDDLLNDITDAIADKIVSQTGMPRRDAMNMSRQTDVPRRIVLLQMLLLRILERIGITTIDEIMDGDAITKDFVDSVNVVRRPVGGLDEEISDGGIIMPKKGPIT